jgi:hypothetical protein
LYLNLKVTDFNRWSVSSCPQSETLNIKSRKRITWVPGRLLVSDAISPILRRAKNAKLLKSVTLIIPRQVDKLICPIESLKRYLSIRSNFPDGNLFIHFDGSNLTRYQFSYILQK